MEKLEKLRKILRSAFSRQHKVVVSHLTESNVTKAKASFVVLESAWVKLHENDNEIFNAMLDDETRSEEDIAKETESALEYHTKFEEIKIQVTDMEESQRQESNDDARSNVSSNNVVDSYNKLNLPPIKIDIFDGEIKNWLPFWGQFEQIHLDESIPTFHKFRILLQSLKEGSRAKQVADSFPISKGNSNYDAVIQALTERFGREDLLIEVYIRELLSMIINNRKSQFSVTDMYDKLECHLRFLEILGITTGKCAAILCPLLESCMPEEFLRTWQRSYKCDEVKDAEQRLTKFREFVKAEVQSEQRISLAVSKFGIVDDKINDRRVKREHVGRPQPKVPTAMGLLTGTESKQRLNCIFCNLPHNSTDCFKARDMKHDDKIQCVRESRSCYVCLKGNHTSKQCNNKSTCPLCSRRHAVIICPNFVHSSKHVLADKNKAVPEVELKRENKPVTNVSTSLTCDSRVILPTVQVNIVGNDGKHYTARAVFDTAAQRSYILNSTAEKVNCEVIGRETLYHSLFGGNRLKSSNHKRYDVPLKSLNRNLPVVRLEALGHDMICGDLPTVPKGPWINDMIQIGIPVSDVLADTGPIELLIGADFAASLFTGNIRKLANSNLVCIETYLGWTVSGKLPIQSKVTGAMLSTTMLVNSMNVSDLWRLDLIGIEEPSILTSKEELNSEVNQYFLDTVCVNNEGRYEVNLPWKQGHAELPSNYEIACKRLKTTCSKLIKDDCYELYDTVFKEWINEGVIEEVTNALVPDEGHYLPHRHVVKLNSSTKVRPVFDASAHVNGCPSLNCCLNKGCNLIEQLTPLIHNFRLHKIGVVADIRRAFLQISVNPKDRKFLKFLWYDSTGKHVVYQHKRVVFGLTCSPFLLAAVIQHHLDLSRTKVNKDDPPYSEATIDYLKRCFYVDNVVISFDSLTEARKFEKEATSVLAEGKFDLRAWEYTDSECDTQCYTSVLGMKWNRKEDTLSLNSDNLHFASDKITKRVIMSATHRVFDPVGIVSPITVCPKLLMKKLWELKLDWDDEVPSDIRNQFVKWAEELKYLDHISVPRWLGLSDNTRKISIHTFTDASENSYAAVVFVRVETQYEVQVQLLQSKTRVSPMKRVTIPRLELLAATIGSRLFSSVRGFFPANCDVYFWTDSTTVIAWIKRADHWSTFVANRVREISKSTPVDQWNYVPGVINPADLPSRGCLGKKLVETSWWEGPDWLYLRENEWPKHIAEYDEECIHQEKRKTTVSMINKAEDLDWYYKYFSSYEKIVRMVAWIFRFVNNCRARKDSCFVKRSNSLTTEEIRSAEDQVCKLIQQESFSGVDDPSIKKLEPFEDNKGLIRLRTKISNRLDSLDFRYPILFPKDHLVVTRLIRSIHERECHVGVKGLQAILRERFWILGGRRTLRSVVSTCVTCRRYDSKRIEAPAIPLPADRVRDASAFEVVGVDLTGPVYLKGEHKAWICLFTCAVVRAVHLELVQSLLTEDFLMALRRFIARRGRPTTIYSDHGTNFVGCANLFQKIDWNKVTEYCDVRRIAWKFNPPTAAWWGGWWERLIGIAKRLLRRVIKKSILTYAEMETILCDIESVINSRPLTYISESDSEPTAITPSLFIQDIKEGGFPEFDVLEHTDLKKKFERRSQIKQDFRDRFRNEYLGLLRSHNKNNKSDRSINIGDIVYIGNDGTKRMEWPIGRVVELFPGVDGRVRLVRVKTPKGECMRPVQRLFSLLESDVDIRCLLKRSK